MAVLREGRYVRKASEGEAQAMQIAQAQAALRGIKRRLDRIHDDEHTVWGDFLRGCRVQIASIEAGPIK